MYNKVFLAMMLLISWRVSYSQFQISTGDAASQLGKAVVHTPSDNGFISAGSTSAGPLGLGDAHLIKHSASGSVTWAKAYGGNGNDFFNSVVQFKNSLLSYAAAGYTNSFGAGSDDAYLVGTDVSGNVLFTKTFGGSGLDRAYCIRKITDPSGNPGFIIVGESNSFPFFGSETTDVYVIRTDINGNLVKSAVIGTSQNDGGYWVEQTADGGYLIAGYTNSACGTDTHINNNIYVVKLQPNLNVVWSKIFASPNNSDESAFCVRENTNNGTIIVTGNTRGFGQQQESFLLNLSATGGFLWMKTYGGAGLEDAESVLVTNDALGNIEYIVAGFSNSFNSTANFDLSVFKTKQNGNLLWTKTYGGPGNEFGYQITPVQTSTPPQYMATGYTNSYGAGSNDVELIYLDNSGNSGSPCEKNPLQIQQSVTPCTAVGAQVVFVSQSLSFQKTAASLFYSVGACFSPSRQGIAAGTDEETSGALLNVGPVPAQSFLKISLSEDMSEGLLRIMNAGGQVVKTETVTSREVAVDVRDLTSGIYVIQLVGKEGVRETKRFVKE